MTSQEILEKYLEFYKKRGHKQIPNVSLVPQNDPTLLFVNSGMFPLVPYLSGEPHPLGKRLVNVQRAMRFAEDLNEVGDNIHTVAFHMIGNWSLGDYFKDEQLPWAYEFLVEQMRLDPKKMIATVFMGDKDAPKDEVSIKILQKIFSKYGISAKENERIFARPKKDNWWQRGDSLGELGGPDSEIHYFIGKGNAQGKDPIEHEKEFVEVGNSVFIQYKKTEKGWSELPQKNVDFGGGLERIAMVVQGKTDIFETDNFWPIILKIQELSGKKYKENELTTRAMRILTDHIRASVFLSMDGVAPGNKDQGYVLRRLIRRMVRNGRVLGIEKDISVSLVPIVCKTFSWLYPQLIEKEDDIKKIFSDEEIKFGKTLDKGAREFEKRKIEILNFTGTSDWLKLSEIAFDLYQSLGYPLEIFIQDIREVAPDIDEKEIEKLFNEKFGEHKDQSRSGAEQKFKGGLADQSENTIKYHTATHLLHMALRKVLGDQIVQHGSNITGERLRFDFNHDKKLSKEEIKKVEDLVNKIIEAGIPVNFEILPKEEALKSGAIHAFNEKYPDQVKVYFIGKNIKEAHSKEFCGGPHVKNTSEIGHIEIYKQDKIGENLLRIYAHIKK
ncbi:hypothetical protein A2V49_00540 [candidate division WWE3 bacterium RBG_19FT_COMBO_34_6]|uniref:alanine--tRNA ligase n=1 Tax=candidate division WWE3 bacterium RBG_19FT_COMBO_34_6 TaxID=1802612 RepID=A0A1F4UNT4_UNCKA|nr:MAG: hypothetical protein A2V49_00540 [candidate division WWE3 bacterium RBG_19FT_COMBO_34_6]